MDEGCGRREANSVDEEGGVKTEGCVRNKEGLDD